MHDQRCMKGLEPFKPDTYVGTEECVRHPEAFKIGTPLDYFTIRDLDDYDPNLKAKLICSTWNTADAKTVGERCIFPAPGNEGVVTSWNYNPEHPWQRWEVVELDRAGYPDEVMLVHKVTQRCAWVTTPGSMIVMVEQCDVNDPRLRWKLQ